MPDQGPQEVSPRQRCPRDSDWCDGRICADLGRIDCPNADPPTPFERRTEEALRIARETVPMVPLSEAEGLAQALELVLPIIGNDELWNRSRAALTRYRSLHPKAAK